ncbi:hypothetical protein PORCRE_1138 [Porphyromonas crevioricanis JCM 15906]|uniref:Uncharacterized protein n=1 Tax=Porphyromonas crevioricanis JCM 15906 TaxID=1305617 RepID=T1CHM5_9PORP|nr:hypothetical protein PORCRE_1138 [Porphyromonas crevioricanis JCM 15906]GAD07659.1 hypothetical protein PORCAN_1283 [Porphyromonas crevioricanis JCM 13913]
MLNSLYMNSTMYPTASRIHRMFVQRRAGLKRNISAGLSLTLPPG